MILKMANFMRLLGSIAHAGIKDPQTCWLSNFSD